jgi:hypothetical protein
MMHWWVLRSCEVNGNKKLVYSGQRPEIVEEVDIGSQGPQRTVVLEEEEKKKNFNQIIRILTRGTR